MVCGRLISANCSLTGRWWPLYVLLVIFRRCGPAPSLPGQIYAGPGCSVVEYPGSSVSELPKVQHSKCCVVSQPPWVQIPASCCPIKPGGVSMPRCRPVAEVWAGASSDARPGPVSQSMLYPHVAFSSPMPAVCSSAKKPGISTITIQIMKCKWGRYADMCR